MNKKLKDELINSAEKATKKATNSKNPEVDEKGYFTSYQDNINGTMSPEHLKMFENGNGNELVSKDGKKSKACAVHSSSMLAYNFFHWIDKDHTLTLGGYEFDKVYFEVHLPVLIGRAKANMDVVLESKNKDALLFIESKFTEHFSNASSKMIQMQENSYSNEESYYPENQKKFKNWEGLIKFFAGEASNKHSKGYYDGIKQEICHLIALTNLINHDSAALKAYNTYYEDDEDFEIHPKITGNETFLFYNIVLEPNENDFPKEKDFYDKYVALYEELGQKLGGLKGDIKMGIKSYNWIYEKMEPIMDGKLKNYLKDRYIQFPK